jgi:predicted neuraminidase
VSWAADSLADQAGWVADEFIYETAPFPECHASTLAETPHGIVAAWFGGTEEKHKDVGIWVAHRSSSGAWSQPVEVANGVQHGTLRYPTWNPVLFQYPDGPLMLFYKAGPDPRTWWGMRTESSDGGKTWSEPVRLPEEIAGPIKNKPILLTDKTLLCGSSTEHDGWRIHVERTADSGRSWERTGALEGPEAIQPTLLTLGGDELKMLCRSRRTGTILEATSSDHGKSWSALTETTLPNPNSGIDAVTLGDGRHLLVYNHVTKGRSPLNVALSADGKQWQAGVLLENTLGEYSYPAVIQTSDGKVHITYTWNRLRIKHVVLDPAKIETRPMADGKWPTS